MEKCFVKFGDDRINIAEIVSYGSIPESGYIVQEDSYLYIETKTFNDKNLVRKYFSSVGKFDIYAKLEELDALLVSV